MSVIDVKNITKKFGSTIALDNISLSIEKNKIYGLLGRNGAGKTTLLNLMTNKFFPTQGDITVDGETVFENDSVLSRIYYMSEQNLYPEGMKVKDAFRWSKEFYPLFDMEYASLLSGKFALNTNKRVKELSTGYGSIFKIIIALSSNAEIILLDEPVLGLDANYRDMFYKELIANYSQNPKTIIISTHLIEEVADVIEDVIIIKEGKVIMKDSVEKILSSGYTVSGPSEKVDKYASDKNIIGSDALGRFKSVYILGHIPGKDDPEISTLDLEISKLNLQKLFINLTNS